MKALGVLVALCAGLLLGFVIGRENPSSDAVALARDRTIAELLNELGPEEIASLVTSLEKRWGVTAAPTARRAPSAHAAAYHAERDQPLIDSPTPLEAFVGKTVRVRGVIENSKPPKLLGLLLWEQDELRGKTVIVRGRVVKSEITKEQHARANAAGPIAMLGPGITYSLDPVEVLLVEETTPE